MTKIAIVGRGSVGSRLGETLKLAGYDVAFGERSDDGTSVRRAVEGASLVFVAVPAEAAVAALEPAGELAGVVVVDCTNPIGWHEGPVHRPPPEGSNAARLQGRFPRARVVKGFNTFPAEVHGRPSIGGRAVDVLLAGDDRSAVATVAEVARRAGFVARDVGPLRNAAHVEALAILVIHLGTVGGLGRRLGLNLDVREEPTTTPSWNHGDVVETIDAPGFSPPDASGFTLRPLVMREGEQPSLLLGTLAAGASIPREIHEDAREHLLLLDGELTYLADDGTSLVLRPGQMGKLAKNVWHVVKNDSDRPARFLVSLS